VFFLIIQFCRILPPTEEFAINIPSYNLSNFWDLGLLRQRGNVPKKGGSPRSGLVFGVNLGFFDDLFGRKKSGKKY
jgi:hypothetical protein